MSLLPPAHTYHGGMGRQCGVVHTESERRLHARPEFSDMRPPGGGGGTKLSCETSMHTQEQHSHK